MARIARNDIILGGLVPVPLDRYTVQILEAKVETAAGKDKDGNPKKPTLRIKAEIIAPPSITHNGEVYQIAGRRFFMMPNSIDPSVDYGLGRIVQGLEISGFDFAKFKAEGDIDTDKFFVLAGHKMDMLLKSHEDFATRPPTPEEEQNGIKERVEILDGEGRKISRGWVIDAQWSDVVGPATADTNTPY